MILIGQKHHCSGSFMYCNALALLCMPPLWCYSNVMSVRVFMFMNLTSPLVILWFNLGYQYVAVFLFSCIHSLRLSLQALSRALHLSFYSLHILISQSYFSCQNATFEDTATRRELLRDVEYLAIVLPLQKQCTHTHHSFNRSSPGYRIPPMLYQCQHSLPFPKTFWQPFRLQSQQ